MIISEVLPVFRATKLTAFNIEISCTSKISFLFSRRSENEYYGVQEKRVND